MCYLIAKDTNTMTHPQLANLLEHLPDGVMLEIIIETERDDDGTE